MKAPPRLLHDPSTPRALRDDLERSAAALPDYDVAAGLAGFQALIGAPSAAGTGAASQLGHGSAASSASTGAASASVAPAAAAKVGWAAVAGGGAVIKAAVVSVAVVGATVAGWPRTTPAPVPIDARPSAQAPARSAPPIAATEAAPPAPAPIPATTQVNPARVPPFASARAFPLPQPSNPDAPLRREIAQLGRIKALVDTEPERAYELAQLGGRQFSRGMLRQEREALAILALWNMGSQAQAQREAREFLSLYPQTPLRSRLEALNPGEAR